jgi:hypothetical protein
MGAIVLPICHNDVQCNVTGRHFSTVIGRTIVWFVSGCNDLQIRLQIYARP